EARRLGGDGSLGGLVTAMIEALSGLERNILRHAEIALLRGRSLDADLYLTQTHRLAALDLQMQGRRITGFDMAADMCAVVAQRLGGATGLRLGAAPVAFQRGGIALAQRADMTFDIGPERAAARRDADFQARLGTGQAGPDAEQQPGKRGETKPPGCAERIHRPDASNAQYEPPASASRSGIS